MKPDRRLLTLLIFLALAGTCASQVSSPPTLEQALSILNDSPWSRQRTFTEVIEGVGSGLFGEKELFNRFYVRILSARPVRDAYRTVRQSIGGQSEAASEPLLEDPRLDIYLAVAVTFRSNDPDLEREVINSLQAQTTETLRNRAYLSTAGFPQLQISGYAAPIDPAIGAVFFFPRRVGQIPVLSSQDKEFVFDLELPDEDETKIRITFPVTPEVLDQSGLSEPLIRLDLPEAATPSETGISTTSGTESGRLSGLVNRFPRQSANSFHGSVYWFHRNDNLDARNFFDEVGQALPEFKRNQFGVSLGAQLTPRLNLFFSYDGLRIVQGSTRLSLVPSKAMKAGDFGELLALEEPVEIFDPVTGNPFPGNQIPQERLHPAALGLLSLLPDPNRDDPVRNFVNNQPVIEDANTITIRADFNLDPESSLTFSYHKPYAEDVGVHPLPAFGSSEIDSQHEVEVGYQRSLGGDTTTEFRLGFEREHELVSTRAPRAPGLVGSLQIEGIGVSDPKDEGYPLFELEDYRSFGDEDAPENQIQNEGFFSGNMSFGLGDHLLQISGEVGFNQVNDHRSPAPERGEFSFSGRYSGDAFADFLLGRAEEASRAIGSSRQDLRSRRFELGLTDRWRINSRLSLSLGLSYFYFQPYRTLRSNISTLQPLNLELGPEARLVVPEDSRGQSVVKPDRNDFAPRLGLAIRPFETSRVVLRASFGIFYEPVGRSVLNYMGRNFPFYYSESSQASIDSMGLDLSDPFDNQIPLELAIRDADPGIRSRYRQEWGFRIETEFTDSWTLEAGYEGGHDVHRRRVLSGNIPTPGTGSLQLRRPNPAFGELLILSSSGSRTRHKLELDLEHHFSAGFSLSTSFELGRAVDDIYNDRPSDPRNLRAERGRSGESDEKQLEMNFIANLPFGKDRALGGFRILDKLLGGFRLSGVVRLSSGEPFSVVLPGDWNNDGLSNDRPDRIGSGRLSSSERSIDRWFDTQAFAFPDPSGFGNAGRNILTGPAYHNWDLSLLKDFNLRYGHRLELRFAFFNALNHANFDNPGRTLGTRSFGVIDGARRAREIEFALKYSF